MFRSPVILRALRTVSAFLLVCASGPMTQPAVAQSASTPHIQALKLTGGQTGYLLVENHLFYTSSLGAQWTDITPPATNATPRGVFFSPTGSGWVLSAADNAGSFSLAHTTDAGQHWTSTTVASPFTDGVPFSGEAHPFFTDEQNGWLMLRVASSSNFSTGILLHTADSGQSWQRLPDPPVGSEVVFTDNLHGTAGPGPRGDEYFSTSDGGLTWTPSQPSLSAIALAANGAQVPTLSAHPLSAVAHALQPGASAPSGALQNPTLSTFANAQQGWVVFNGGSCTATACTQTQVLEGTLDGGHTFFALGKLPNISLESVQTFALTPSPASAESRAVHPNAVTPALPTAAPLINQMGFDKCEILTPAQMQDWFTNSPYRAVGAYIGGISRACTNAGFTAAWTAQILSQGWGIIPIWVGPQAPNSTLAHKLTGVAATDQATGVSEADAAVAQMTALGFGPGSMVMYDMEAYTRTTASEASTQAFFTGWISELHAKGFKAATYSSHPEIQDWEPGKTGTDSLDDIWFAYFFSSGVACGTKCQNTTSSDIPDTYWSNHQRIRQTSSSFTSTYGSTAASIDEDWTDGDVDLIATGNSLTVKLAGTGTGTVTSSDTFITCSDTTGATGNVCSAIYANGTAITLTAKSDTLSTFTGFTGCTTVSGTTCTVSPSAAATVTATFTITPPVFTLAASSTNITWTIGGQASSTITLKPNAPYQGTFTLGCTGLQQYLHCSFSPATLVADGSGTALTSTLTLTASSASVQKPRHTPSPIQLAFLLPAIAGLALTRRRLQARGHQLNRLTLLLLAVGTFALGQALTGCSSSAPVQQPISSAPIQITATSNGVTQSVSAFVTVYQ